MNIIETTKNALRATIQTAWDEAAQAGQLPATVLPAFVIEKPKDAEHGDFATNIAMQMAKVAKKSPRDIATVLIERMDLKPPFAAAEIAGPGFINFRLTDGWLLPVLSAAQKEDKAYGASDAGQGERMQVEFVSANPTGLLHMGNARGGALGDALVKVLNKAGYRCDSEYYINDTGNQVHNLGLSVESRYFELLGRTDYPFPEDGYKGQDIIDTAQKLLDRDGDLYVTMGRDERLAKMTEFTLAEKVGGIRHGLERFGIHYDRWFSERSLHESGDVQAAVDVLRERGFTYEKEGAVWLASTKYGDEKDEVLIRSNGTPTYFAADIAYHKNKFDRGYNRLINIWGADHHGHVQRIKNALTALGYPGDQLHIILIQLVRLYREGELVRMSKRAGQYVTLEELMDEVGRDAARFFFSMRNPDSALDFDLDLAKSESSENPVYYVQYAHARICSLLSINETATPQAEEADLSLLKDPHEIALLEQIAALPEEVALAAKEYAPYRLAYYAKDLANRFHSFYNGCKVLTDDTALRQARLVLVDAARISLRNVLELLGVDAPERM